MNREVSTLGVHADIERGRADIAKCGISPCICLFCLLASRTSLRVRACAVRVLAVPGSTPNTQHAASGAL